MTARLTIVNPIAIPQGDTAVAVAFPLAARPTSLDGLRVGLFWNGKNQGDVALAAHEGAWRSSTRACTFTHYLGDKGGLHAVRVGAAEAADPRRVRRARGHHRRLRVVHVVAHARDGRVRGARPAHGVVGGGRVRGGRAVLGRGVRLPRPAVRGRAVAVHQRRSGAHRADGRRRDRAGDRGAHHHPDRGAGPAGVRSPHAVRRRRASRSRATTCSSASTR